MAATVRSAQTRASLGAAIGLAACLLLPGCGLVFVPRFQSFPGAIQTVRVLDADTRQPLADARVDYVIVPYSNWMHFHPHVYTDDGSNAMVPPTGSSALPVESGVQGDFRIVGRRTMLGTMQWFFPWPSPLGWTLFHEHEAALTVSAPGYEQVQVRYAPDYLKYWDPYPLGRERCEYHPPQLTVYLHKAAPAADPPHRAARPAPWYRCAPGSTGVATRAPAAPAPR